MAETPEPLALDSEGNVIVVAMIGDDEDHGVPDYITVKYDGVTGDELWAVRYDGPNAADDIPTWVTVDGDDHVIVTGRSVGKSSGVDYLTVKYNGATGVALWVARFDGPEGLWDAANSVVVDGRNDVIVTGEGHGIGLDYVTVKYAGATGAQLWVARYNGPANLWDRAFAVAVNEEGDVVVTGSSPAKYPHGDIATVKYDGVTGNQLWVARYDGPTSSYDGGAFAAFDRAGNVLIAGWSFSSGARTDYASVKYDGATGAELWTAHYNGPANFDDSPAAAAVDDQGNLIVTGVSSGITTRAAFATVKYAGDTGAELWVSRFDGGPHSIQSVYSVALARDGNVLVTGSSWVKTTFSSRTEAYTTVKCDGLTGAQLWVARYDGVLPSREVGYSAAVDADDNVVVTGISEFNDLSGPSRDIVTIKYVALPLATDVTAACRFTRGPLKKNRRTGRWVQKVTVKYLSNSPVAGPISLALDSLTYSVTLFNRTGETYCALPGGSPYRDSPRGLLRRGTTVSFPLEFINDGDGAITYTPRVLAGTGAR